MRLRFDDYILDVARRELWCGSKPVAVERQIFDLLAYLVQHPERVVSKDELLQAVLRRKGVISDRTGVGFTGLQVEGDRCSPCAKLGKHWAVSTGSSSPSI